MQPSARRQSRRNTTIAALVCAALIIVTFALAEMKRWTRKPTDAGVCPDSSLQWRQTALKGKLDSTDSPALNRKAFTIQPGSYWDKENRHWVVQFRTPDQPAADLNFTALIDCTGAVTLKDGTGA